MTGPERALVELAATMAASDADALDRALDRAHAQADGTAVEEVILQSYLFVGFPATLRAMRAWRRRTGIRAPAQATADDATTWRARGERVCRAIYTDQYRGLRDNIATLHPDLDRWMVDEGYGKVLGRPGLPLRVRELCIIALLAVQEAPEPLYSHLRGALNVGASPAEIEEAIAIACATTEAHRTARAFEVWDAVRVRNA